MGKYAIAVALLVLACHAVSTVAYSKYYWVKRDSRRCSETQCKEGYLISEVNSNGTMSCIDGGRASWCYVENVLLEDSGETIPNLKDLSIVKGTLGSKLVSNFLQGTLTVENGETYRPVPEIGSREVDVTRLTVSRFGYSEIKCPARNECLEYIQTPLNSRGDVTMFAHFSFNAPTLSNIERSKVSTAITAKELIAVGEFRLASTRETFVPFAYFLI